ncbi:hypothetical protein PoB_007275700 [Plakobranchus ocellatus]|uniref:Uncharacterized protein n=1 Tax=Plakobranchus ocellatus TaxID=259542 RepID=A0AAV4DQ66_9GAST|nr:hypothetical protein PoB_007275700 [Plakobranchus ocellatus]
MFSGGPKDQKNNTGPVSDELAVFRPTHKANAVTMKRFPHQQLGDFQLNNFAVNTRPVIETFGALQPVQFNFGMP